MLFSPSLAHQAVLHAGARTAAALLPTSLVESTCSEQPAAPTPRLSARMRGHCLHQVWKRQRTLTSPAFFKSKIASLFPAVQLTMQRLHAKVQYNSICTKRENHQCMPAMYISAQRLPPHSHASLLCTCQVNQSQTALNSSTSSPTRVHLRMAEYRCMPQRLVVCGSLRKTCLKPHWM